MLRKLVKTGLLDLIAANFMMQFVGFGVLLVLPRFLDTAAFGQIRVMQSYGDMLVILAGFGMNTAVLKACAGDVRPERLSGLLRVTSERSLLLGGITVAGVSLAVWFGAFDAHPEIVRWMPIFALVVPFQALALLLMAYLQARQRIREMARAQLWVRVQSALLIVLATWQFGIGGFVAASIFAAALALWPFVRLVGRSAFRAARVRLDEAFKHVAWYSLLGNVLNTATKYADLYVLGLFATSSTELGHYALASMLVLPGSVIISSIQSTAIPLLAARSDEPKWFTRAAFRTQAQTVALALIAALGIRIAAPVLIQALYDESYLAALPYLDILLIHYVLRSAYAVMGAGHIALGRTDFNFVASAIGAPIALGLSYLALERFGTDGIAWAKTLTAALLVFVYAFLMRKALSRVPEGAAGP